MSLWDKIASGNPINLMARVVSKPSLTPVKGKKDDSLTTKGEVIKMTHCPHCGDTINGLSKHMKKSKGCLKDHQQKMKKYKSPKLKYQK